MFSNSKGEKLLGRSESTLASHQRLFSDLGGLSTLESAAEKGRAVRALEQL